MHTGIHAYIHQNGSKDILSVPECLKWFREPLVCARAIIS